MIQGIDCSHWQDDKSTPRKMDFGKAKAAGAEFAFIKISERGGLDIDHDYNWRAAKEAGIPRGGYHFLRWDISGALQAKIFCDILEDDPGELPPVADFEAPIKDGKYPSNSLLLQFLETVEDRLDIKPMIYTSPGFWNAYGKNKNTGRFEAYWARYDLWIANYFKTYVPGVTQPMEIEPWKSLNIPYKFWQYTSTGDGYKYGAESKAIDLNWFNGDIVDFHAYLGNGVIVVDPGQPPVNTVPIELFVLDNRVTKIENWIKGF